MDLYNFYIQQIPIPQSVIDNFETQQPFINLVNQILAITKDADYLKSQDKQEKVKEYEKQIDQMVYKIYELIPEEIEIVEKYGKES